MAATGLASLTTLSKWVDIFHITTVEFPREAYETVIARFSQSLNSSTATLSYDPDLSAFEARCLSHQTEQVTKILAAIVANFVFEKEHLAPGAEAGIVEYNAFLDVRDDLKREAQAEQDEALIDFGQIDGQTLWSPLRECDLTKVVAPHVLDILKRLTGCDFDVNSAASEVKILPGVTGSPSSAISKLNVLAEHLAQKPIVFHTLKVKLDLALEYALFRLLDSANPYNNYDGTLRRLLVSPQIPALFSQGDGQWGKAIANFRLLRAFKNEKSHLTPMTRTPRLLPMKDPAAVSNMFHSEMRMRPIGSEPPTEHDIAPAIHSPTRTETKNPASQSIHEWLKEVPSNTSVPNNPPVAITSENETPASSTARSVRPATAKREWENKPVESNPWDNPAVSGDAWGSPASPPKSSDFPTIQPQAPHTVAWSPGVRNGPASRALTSKQREPFIPGGTRRESKPTGLRAHETSAVTWSQAARGGPPAMPGPQKSRGFPPRNRGPGNTWGQVRRNQRENEAMEAAWPKNAPTQPENFVWPTPGEQQKKKKENETVTPAEHTEDDPRLIRTMRQQATAPSVAGSTAFTEDTVVLHQTDKRSSGPRKKTSKNTASEVPGNEVKIRERMAAASTEAGVKATQQALNNARAFSGALDMRVEVGQIFVSSHSRVPSDSRSGIGHTGFVSAMQSLTGFDKLYDNFTPGITTRVEDLDYILEFTGIRENETPYEMSCLLYMECITSSKETLTLVIDLLVSDSDKPQPDLIKTETNLFGAWYSHHPLRVWDHRLSVTGQGLRDIREVQGMQALRDNLYVRFSEQPQIRGKDGDGVRVQHTRLVKKARYEIPEQRSMFYLEVAQVTELAMMRPNVANQEVSQPGLFIGVQLSDSDAKQRQFTWCEASFGFVTPPSIFAQNLPSAMEFGDKASWDAEKDIPEPQIQQLFDLGTSLVETSGMDNVGSDNYGLAAAYEANKQRKMHARASRAAASEWS